MAHNFQQNFNAMLRPPMLLVDQQQQPTLSNAQFTPSPNAMIVPNASTPWNVENMPWAQPVGNLGIMHFEARTNLLDEHARRVLLHAKRKSNPPAIAPPPKQFITEEKITAHFNGLHISNNFTQNENVSSITSMEDDAGMSSSVEKPTSFASYQDYRLTAKELEEKLRNANRITLCEDLKKMEEEQKKSTLLTTLIPEALMNRIEKPCTALVLWQPPPILGLLHRKNDEELRKANEQINVSTIPTTNVNRTDDFIEDIEFSETDDIDDFIDNNNTCAVDYNKFSGDMDEDL